MVTTQLSAETHEVPGETIVGHQPRTMSIPVPSRIDPSTGGEVGIVRIATLFGRL